MAKDAMTEQARKAAPERRILKQLKQFLRDRKNHHYQVANQAGRKRDYAAALEFNHYGDAFENVLRTIEGLEEAEL
jgi:hypothetical protein